MPSDLYRVIYTVQKKKILPAEQAWPRPHSAQFTMSQISVPVMPKVLGHIHPNDFYKIQHWPENSLLSWRSFFWCRGCSWKLLIIKTRLRTKPIAQIPDEHGRSPDVSQYLRLSDCWLSQDVPLLQHPTSTAYCLPFLRDSCDPTASPNWDKPTSPAEGKNGLVPFTAVEQLPRACSRGKQDPTETWNKHITSVAALDWGDTAV